ncbi:MAG: hypothetical protein ACKVJX_11715 [Verrucomicrobiia bacterium]|jgi:hypothetical protein
MNPKPNAPETLSSHWKPREPSAGSRARLFGPGSQVRDYSLTTFLRWIVPATACLFALCVSIVDFKPGARPAVPEVNAGDLGLSNSIERCLSDQSVSPAGGNNRLAQIGRKSNANRANESPPALSPVIGGTSISILEWTKPSPSNSTKGFLLQTVTNSAMF